MMTDDPNLFDIYHRFCQEIKSGTKDLYYDEDDLVIIFDLASDVNDSYAQLEALMLGRRLYPDSEELALREGLMINPDDEKALNAFLETHSSRKGVLWDILRLKAAHLNPLEAISALDKMLDEVRFTDDEEIIQYANLVAFYEAHNWFASNYERFIDKCEYRDTALNEASLLLEDIDLSVSISLLEELSRIDPFNADTWLKLSELYLYAHRIEDASSAIGYAAAIRPEDTAITEISTQIDRYKEGQLPTDTASEETTLTPRVNDLMLNNDTVGALKLLQEYEASYGGVYHNAYLLIQLLYNRGDIKGIIDYMERQRPDDAPELRMDPLSLAMYAAALLRAGRYQDAASTAKQYLVDADTVSTSLLEKMGLAGTKIALNYIITAADRGEWNPDDDPIVESLK
ncbi:MAG: hypothetical protein HDS75_05335 [Bacteroidales bacterium]|nr:hypothetical protein [Bacteroidales bacterium]